MTSKADLERALELAVRLLLSHYPEVASHLIPTHGIPAPWELLLLDKIREITDQRIKAIEHLQEIQKIEQKGLGPLIPFENIRVGYNTDAHETRAPATTEEHQETRKIQIIEQPKTTKARKTRGPIKRKR